MMKSAPYLSQSSRIPCKNPDFGGTQFILPATGSMMTQEILSGYCSNSAFTESRLLYSAVNVYFAKSSGTPGELG